MAKYKKAFNTREFRMMGKNGNTFDKELRARMDKEFTPNFVDSMMRLFKQNSKRKSRQRVNKDTFNSRIPSISKISELHEGSSCNCDKAVALECSECEQPDSVESVQGDIEFLHSSLFENEVSRRRLSQKEKENADAIFAIDIELDEVKNQLQVLSSKRKKLVAKGESIQASISQVNADNSLIWGNLQAAELKLQDLMTVTIFVYSDGTIEAENFQEFEKYHVDADLNSYKSNQFEDLTVKQIRQLDFLQRVTRVLSKDNRAFKILFDSSELEKAWNVMHN